MRVPVCYGGEHGPDLDELAAAAGLTVEEAIELHCAPLYRVFMIGFMPGFAYLGLVDDRLAAPRRAEPRVRVPAGSVGIAGRQTGIYPADTPGGWMLVGRTPMRPFDLARETRACSSRVTPSSSIPSIPPSTKTPGEVRAADRRSEETPAAMPSRGLDPRRGISVSSRWGWGPSASENAVTCTSSDQDC